MHEPTKAVFLSYASQDAEAARHIAESLRASGVEVWFDVEGGLEHGDEWDAKIRRQIKECVLFIPLISANTQSRLEGYFRIEWDLAAERARGIASGVAFILPVVIDDTREPDALVPDRFRAVQWTKAPDGKVPPAVLERFLKLWSHRIGVVSHQATQSAVASNLAESAPTPRKRRPVWLVPAIVGVLAIAALAIWQSWQRSDSDQPARPELARGEPAESVERATASASEARQLTAKAWDLMTKPGMVREELDAADDLCKRAAALDSNDAEVWAAWSQVDSWYVYHRLERTPARQDGARTKAARALNLSPRSYEARLAQACYLVREGGGQHAVYDLDEAESILQSLLQENADEPRALLALGVLYRNTGKVPEYRDAFSRMARTPNFAAQAHAELGWAEFFNGNFDEADVAVDISIKLQPYYGNLVLKTYLFKYWWGDLEQAKAALDKFPAGNRLEDYAVSTQVELDHWQRKPDAMLHLLDRFSRDWIESNAYDGPKAWWSGLAHHLAGREEAARLQWRTGLRAVERRLIDQPDSSFLLRWKARLLLASGNQAEGETALRLARELGSRDYFNFEAIDEILLGDTDTAITILEQRVEERERFLTATNLRLHPSFDPLRDLPRFQTLLARMEADPRFSPKAKPPSAPSPISQLPSPADQPKVDQKSVAVLAFANLSDDKGNEYFSDGISEELLNVLAKVPGLKVTARTSAFFFKGKQVPIADIAQQLGVAYVIEGSVRKQGDRVRITAQLIKAADGFPVWSDTFTRDLKDIFAVQDEIAGLIAQQLQLKLGATKVARVVNPEAYRLVLEGRYFWLQRTDEALNRAEASYVEALEHDPQFAQAHAGLADVWSIRAWYKLIGGNRQAQDDLARAHTEVRLAIEIDPSLAETHATLGAVLFNQRKFAEANEAFQTSQRLNPNYGFAHFWYAQLLFAEGRSQEGLLALDRAVRADPLAFITLASYAIFLSQLGLNEEALVMNDRAIALHPDMFVPTIGQRADILLNLGRTEEALALARSVVQQASVEPRWWLDGTVIHALRAAGQLQEAEAHAARLLQTLPPDNMVRGYVLAGVGRPSEAVDQLLATGLESSLIFSFIFDSFWDEVRQDPRLPELLVKLNLVEEYQRGREALAQLDQERERKK